jgi:hypothetical protein
VEAAIAEIRALVKRIAHPVLLTRLTIIVSVM